MLYAARWWTRRTGGRIECRLCPRCCKLSPGQHGFCQVRRAQPDGLVLDTYGRTSGLAVDPVEKKPLYHFLPGSRILSLGTPGCNLRCDFCQNWRLSQAPADSIRLVEASPEDVAQAAEEEGCLSVAFTYNDPIIWAEYAIDTALACHQRKLRSVVVTAGYISGEARAEFFSVMDAANIDLKAFSEEFYRVHCRGRLQVVLDTLRFVKAETRTWLEVTTLLIPGLNDGLEELDRMTDWFAENLGLEVPWHFTAFHPNHLLRDRRSTPRQTLEEAREMARSKGLRYVYTGNILGGEGGRTHCPRCGTLLISREGFHVSRINLQGTACPQCGQTIPGVFEA